MHLKICRSGIATCYSLPMRVVAFVTIKYALNDLCDLSNFCNTSWTAGAYQRKLVVDLSVPSTLLLQLQVCGTRKKFHSVDGHQEHDPHVACYSIQQCHVTGESQTHHHKLAQ